MDKHGHNDNAMNFLNAPLTGVTVAFWQANQTSLDAGPNFNIDDTAANIQSALNGLSSDTHISQIVISDGAPIVLTVSKLTTDAAALGKLINQDSSPAALTVKDTALHIGNNFATIGASSQVTSIVVSDNAVVTLTASQVTNNAQILGELVNANASAANVTLKDSAAHIQAAGVLDVAEAHLSTITSIVVSNSAVMTLTASQVALDSDALALVVNNNGNPVTFKVSDTAANITSNLGALENNGQVTQITDNDNGAIGVNVAQIQADAGALGKIVNANGGPITLNVTDVAANIQAAFDTLNNNSQITKIIVSDSATNEVTITAAQAASDGQALSHLYQAGGTTAAHVAVSDTAANVSSAFDALNGNTHVDKIIVSDSATHEVKISVAQAASDTAALAELYQANGTSAAHVAVSDISGNISAAFDALNSNSAVDKIIVTNSAGHEVVITAAQASQDSTALAELVKADGTTPATVTVSDTAADISSAFGALNGNGHVDKIIVSDSAANEVTITVAQAAADTTALAELFQANGTSAASVAVGDTAAAISGAFDALNGNTHVNKIIVSDSATNEVTINVAQATSDTTALSELFQAGGTTAAYVAVSDTAANISTAFDALNGNGQVNKIIVSNSGSAEVTVTAAQAASDGTALGELYLANGTTAAHVEVSDTAANISAAFDALNSNTHVDKIVITPSAALTLSAGQVVSDTTALGEIQGGYSIAVTDTAANVTTNLDALASNGHVTQIIISDNAEVTVTTTQLSVDGALLDDIQNANSTTVHVIVADTAGAITAQIGGLNGNTLVNKIVVTDSATNEVTLSVAQVGADAHALSELFQANGSTPANFAVSDTAASISSAFDTLSGNSQLNKIIVNDSATNEVTITAAQAASDTAALNELKLADGTTAAHVAVGDTAANIATAFDALNGNSHVNKIIVSDSGANEVTITVAQAAADMAALAELFQSNGTTAAHVAVSDTAAAISGAFDALSANSHVNKIIVSDSATNEVTITAAQAAADTTALTELFAANGTTAAHVAVSDTASNISGAFDALNGNSHVDKIIVSDSATNEVTITAALAASDTTTLNELFTANGTTAAHVAVSDTASNISGAFDALNGNSHVDKIIVSDSATNEVTITAALAASDTTALNELKLADGTTPAHVAVSDTAANISSAFDALNGNSHVDKIIVSNSGSAEVTITVAQLGSDTIALGELKQSNGTTAAHVAISDTAADISAAFDTLNANTQVDHITITPSGALTLTAGQVVSDTVALGEITNSPYSISVTDTAANVTANLDALQANGHVGAITISDNAEITVSVAQLTSDATVIGEIVNQNATTVHVVVSDTASDISAAFNSLNGSALVNKIIVSDSATHEVTITALQASSDVTALNELFQANGSSAAFVTVSDSATDITSALDALSSNSHVNKIIVSDGPANEVSITVAQLSSDATALNEIYNADTSLAQVHVTDTAANISAAFNLLSATGQINKIVVSDSASHEVTLTVAQTINDTNGLSELYLANGTTLAHVAVSDTAVNISSNLDALNSDTQVDHIIISDNGAITLTVAQATGDSTAIGELANQNGNPVSLTVQDTAAAISAALDTLNGETNISAIVISDSASLNLNAIQITSDASALAKLSNFNHSGVTINVTDTAAHISANLEALQANNDIVSITVSDNAPITVTVAQITSDAVVLSELQNSDNSQVLLTVDDTAANIRANLASLNQNLDIHSIVISNNAVLLLTVAQLGADAHALSIMSNANGNPYAIRISDTAAHISAALDTLSANTHVTTIVVTDSAAIVLNISQITSDAHALGETVNSNASPYTLSVHDSAANISAAFDALNGNSHVAKIVVSDSATNEVLISAGQFASDIPALAELFQANGTTQAHVNVADTAANVTTALNSLVSTQADKITVTDSATNEVLVSVAQITSDAAALAKLFNADGSTPANVAVSDSASDIAAALNALTSSGQVNKIIVSDSATNEVTVSSIANIAADSTALSELYKADGTTLATYAVSDTAANIGAALDVLNANTRLDKIVVSDSNINFVQITAAQYSNDHTALAELVQSNGFPASVGVTDTAANISAIFDSLAHSEQVARVVVTDSATNEITLTATQLANDAGVLNYTYDADDSTPAQVIISDAAAGISANFDLLNGNSHVNKIIVTNSGSNEVTITAAQAHNDTVALAELYNSDGTTLAHVAVSDTAADISAALAQLNLNTQVDHITISDGNPLMLTTSQVVHDTTALGEIVGTYTIVVSDTAAHVSANLDALEANASVTQIIISDNKDITVSIAQLTNDANVLSVTMDANGISPAALKIVDTAANIQSNLGNLEADGFSQYIDVIVVSDNGTIGISASQFEIDIDALFALRNANGTKVSLTMSDTSGNLQQVLDEIQEFNNFSGVSRINSIVVTNNAQLTITAAQVYFDAQVLSEIQNRNGSPVSFKVNDTAANISAFLDALQANGHLSTIVISDSAAIGLSVAQLTSDAAAIALFHNQDSTAYELAVTDTAANIHAALTFLNNHSHLEKIIVSDSATHEVSFTSSQLTHDTAVLGKLYDADGVTHASIELVDTAGHIQALTAAQFQALASEGVNQIDSSNNKLLLHVAQYEGLGTVALTQSDVVTLSDTGAAISSMTAAQLGALLTNGVDKIVVTDHALTLGVDQWNALGVSVDAATTVTINGTSGNDSLTTNAGTFVVNGGGGADTFTLGTGHHDQFVYTSTSDSTGANYDTIHNLNTQVDSFNLNVTVQAIDAAVHAGVLDAGANFDTDLAADIGAGQLGANHAVLFTATSGSLAGHTFLIVDANGVAGYQAGQDYVIDVTGGQHLGGLSTADFFTTT